MGKITILPDSLCNQIAAGEVVERPAAVVKELMENSIDAGSRRITVTLQQGGRREIRVVDDGVGMNPDDALLALERHATSKIKTLEDLQAVHSLGFRGEALPSIASVSRFELITREAEAVSGTLIRIEGGRLRDVKEAGCPPGTMITVRDLFHNIPARRKFLRAVDTEMAHISDQFLRLAMAHPDIHFQMSHQGRSQYDFPRTVNGAERATQIFGAGLAGTLLPFAEGNDSLSLRGLAGPPQQQRSNARSLFVYVNGRPVWDRTLNRAVLDAYETLLPRGKYPLLVLFVRMSPGAVDVNVHPTKREVRFRSPGEILERVRGVIRTVLVQAGQPVPLQGPARPTLVSQPFGRPPQQSARESQIALEKIADDSLPPAAALRPVQVSGFPALSVPAMSEPAEVPVPAHTQGRPVFSRLPVLGQLANTYVLLEASDGLILLDQHAAHERILYDRLSSKPSGETGRQRLARSAVLDLFPREASMLRRWLDQLREIGFEIETFGGDSFVIHAVPAILSDRPPDVLIRDLLEAAHEEEKVPRWDILASLAKSASCHGAIRAGQKLQREEIRSLLHALDNTVVSATCPHGRPLWCKLTHAEIARLFHRT